MIEPLKRLNFGAGYVLPQDWTNVDKLDYGGNVVADVLEGLPFPDEHFDYIVANHTIQMIRFHDLSACFAELRRVLKRDGVLRILVPDFTRALIAWKHGEQDFFPIADDVEPTWDGKFLRYIFWHGDTRSAFTVDNLIDTLERSQFSKVYECFFNRTESTYSDIVSLDSRRDESLVVEAMVYPKVKTKIGQK